MKNGINVLFIALVAALALAVAAPAFAAETKIGVVEPQKVLDGTRAGKKIKDSLQDYVKARQKVIDMEEEDLKKAEEDLVKQGAVLSPEAKKDKEDKFRQKMGEYQRKVQQLNQEVQVKKKETLDEFNKSLEQIIRGIADREKITLVVEKGDSGAGALIIYSHPSLDLTDRVIKDLDAKGGK
ncbi:MAG: OmpH family outer membrane protein [Nitrospirae bacterium]|nr:OmpH family outer membrane protein [Nitrospirota bacterium]